MFKVAVLSIVVFPFLIRWMHLHTCWLKHLIELKLTWCQILHLLSVPLQSRQQVFIITPCARAKLSFIMRGFATCHKILQPRLPDNLMHIVFFVELDGDEKATEHITHLNETSSIIAK